MALPTAPVVSVHESLANLEDFQLVQRCIDQEPEALQLLQRTYGPAVAAYLTRCGAAIEDAEEIVAELWADCIVAAPGESPRIARYDGSCQLGTWLNTVAFNRLLTLRRKQKRLDAIGFDSLDMEYEDGLAESEKIPAKEPEYLDFPLVDLLRGAIEAGFASCSPEQFVMLQLAYGDGLRIVDLASIWQCNAGTISRRLEDARQSVAAGVLKHIRSQDQMLKIEWQDFLQLCRMTSVGALGF